MTDFFTPARCSSSGQTCSTSDVVRPEVNKINGLTEVEDKHFCPLVRPLFVLKMKAIAMGYLKMRTNNGSPHTTYGGPTNWFGPHSIRSGVSARGDPVFHASDGSDDGGPHRQAHDHRRLPPEQPTRKGDHPWLT